MKLRNLTTALCAALLLASCANDNDDLKTTVQTQEAVRDTNIKSPFLTQTQERKIDDEFEHIIYESGLTIEVATNERLSVPHPGESQSRLIFTDVIRKITGSAEEILLPEFVNHLVLIKDENGKWIRTTESVRPKAIGWRFNSPMDKEISSSFKRMYVPKQYKYSNQEYPGSKGNRRLDAETFIKDFIDNRLEYIYIDTDYTDPVDVCSINGALYSFDMKTFQLCPIGRKGHLVLAEGTEVIASKSFAKCLNLNTITIPASIKRIESNSISNTPKLKEINILATTPPEVEPNAFGQNVLSSTIRVPAGSEEAYRNAPGFSNCKKIIGCNF